MYLIRQVLEQSLEPSRLKTQPSRTMIMDQTVLHVSCQFEMTILSKQSHFAKRMIDLNETRKVETSMTCEKIFKAKAA